MTRSLAALLSERAQSAAIRIAVVGVLIGGAGGARAEAPPVAIEASDPSSTLVSRLRATLLAQEHPVVIRTSGMLNAETPIALRVTDNLDAVRVCTLDAAAERCDVLPAEAVGLWIVRIAETVRIRSLELSLAASDAPDVAPLVQPEETERPPLVETAGVSAAEVEQGKASIRMGLGTSLSFDQLSPTFDARLVVRVSSFGRGSVAALAQGSFLPARVSEPEGRGRVWPTFAGLALLYRALPATGASPWRVEVGAFAGAAWLRLKGNAEGEFTGTTTDRFGALLAAYGSVSWAVSDAVSIGVDALVGGLAPAIHVQVLDRNVASFGWPYVALSAGPEIFWR